MADVCVGERGVDRQARRCGFAQGASMAPVSRRLHCSPVGAFRTCPKSDEFVVNLHAPGFVQPRSADVTRSGGLARGAHRRDGHVRNPPCTVTGADSLASRPHAACPPADLRLLCVSRQFRERLQFTVTTPHASAWRRIRPRTRRSPATAGVSDRLPGRSTITAPPGKAVDQSSRQYADVLIGVDGRPCDDRRKTRAAEELGGPLRAVRNRGGSRFLVLVWASVLAAGRSDDTPLPDTQSSTIHAPGEAHNEICSIHATHVRDRRRCRRRRDPGRWHRMAGERGAGGHRPVDGSRHHQR